MTDSVSPDHLVTSMEALERLYGEPFGPSLVKETDRITAHVSRLHRSGAVLRAGVGGPDGLDCSPRGDAPGFVRVADEKTLLDPGPARQQPHRHVAQHHRTTRAWRCCS